MVEVGENDDEEEDDSCDRNNAVEFKRPEADTPWNK